MEEYENIDSSFSELLDIRIETDSQLLEYQRALEFIYQTLSSSVQDSIKSLPNRSELTLLGSIDEINKLLSAHHSYSDPEMIEYIGNGLMNCFKDFQWKEYLKQNILKQWTILVSDLSTQKVSSYFPKIDELIRSTYRSLQNLLLTMQDLLMTTPIKYNIFPQITTFDSFFNEKNQELRQKTKKLKLQLKFCPGVEPPVIKRVQYETFTMVKKNYTEWNTFIEDELVEVEKAPVCTMVPLLHRFFFMLTESKLAVVSYYAPVGWEVTRVNALVVDGFFKECNIKRSVCRENKAKVEVEIVYPKMTRENVWCKVRLEGVISRKRILDVRVPHIKDVLVVVDENGEHELPEGVIDFDDIEI